MTLRSVSPAYIAAKERARDARAAAEDRRRRQQAIAEDTFAQACVKELCYRLRRRRRFSWNPWDWIPS